MQSGLSVGTDGITGTLKKLTSGELVNAWGEGYFMAIQLGAIDERATSVKVGMDPSAGGGLVEIINDPDKNGAFKITDKDNQKFKVVITDGETTTTRTYDLSGLILKD